MWWRFTSGGPDLRQRQAAFRTISSFSVKTGPFLSTLVGDSPLSDSLSDMMIASRVGCGVGWVAVCDVRGRRRRRIGCDFAGLYGPTFTSVVPDNTTRLVSVSVGVSIDTFQRILFFNRGPSANFPLLATFPSFLTVSQPRRGTVIIQTFLFFSHSHSVTECFVHRVETLVFHESWPYIYRSKSLFSK